MSRARLLVLAGCSALVAFAIYMAMPNSPDVGDAAAVNEVEQGDKLSASPSVVSVLRSGPEERMMVGPKAFLLDDSRVPVPGKAVDVLESLKVAAEAGDAGAALDAYVKVQACKRAATQVVTPQLLDAYRRAGIDVDSAVSSLERDIDECVGLEGRQDLLANNWLEISALNGSIEGKLLYATDVEAVLGSTADILSDPEGLIKYRRQAMGFLRGAASEGSVDALIVLSRAYREGVLVEANPDLSYAYYLAAAKAHSASVSPEVLDALQSGGDEARGRRLADEIYRSCCVN